MRGVCDRNTRVITKHARACGALRRATGDLKHFTLGKVGNQPPAAFAANYNSCCYYYYYYFFFYYYFSYFYYIATTSTSAAAAAAATASASATPSSGYRFDIAAAASNLLVSVLSLCHVHTPFAELREAEEGDCPGWPRRPEEDRRE